MHMLYVPKKPPPQVRWWIWVYSLHAGHIPLFPDNETSQKLLYVALSRARLTVTILASLNHPCIDDGATEKMGGRAWHGKQCRAY